MSIIKYMLGRLAQAIPMLLAITVLLFFLIKIAPGDPVSILYGMQPGRDFRLEEMEAMRHRLGLDQPIYVQYLAWLSRFLKGDLGFSYVYRVPVADLIFSRVWNTVKLCSASLLISMSIGIPVGIISAAKQYSKTDNSLMGLTLVLWSLPSWWIGMVLLIVFSAWLNWLPSHGATSTVGIVQLPFWTSVGDELAHLALPAITLGATVGTAYIARLVRSSMLDVLRQDYILTARAKGLKERIVVYKHAFRNAMLPVVTMIGLYVGLLIGYGAAVEVVFAYEGLGMLMVRSAYARDYPVTMGLSLIIAVVVIISVLVTDVLYAYIDPRIRY